MFFVVRHFQEFAMSRFKTALFAILLPFVALGQNTDDKVSCKIIYLPTPQSVVEKMLDLVKVTKDDIVYDLGCGDGRIVCTAAKKFGAKGVGVDIDPARIKDCADTMKKFELTAEQVEIRQGDALKVNDLEKATVIAFYMLPEFMEKLEPQVLKRLKPGTRLVAHEYPFPNLNAEQVIEFEGPARTHTLYVWTVKEKKAETPKK
jgi:precorrin-6B methylase 2